MDYEFYEKLAEDYIPKDKIKYLFIAEAPPYVDEGEKPRYFYSKDVAKYDHLLSNIANAFFSEKYNKRKKEYWLRRLEEKGFFLIDAIEKPIRSGLSDKVIAGYINEYFPRLVQKIEKYTDKDTKIILIKKVVYNTLKDKLRERGFNVINIEMLPFPSKGGQTRFKEGLRKLFPKGL